METEKLRKKILDRLFNRRWLIKWVFGGGIGDCYTAKTRLINGKLIQVSVWRYFKCWEGDKKTWTYTIYFHDLARSEEPERTSGPLLWKTEDKAEELFNLLHGPLLKKWKADEREWDRKAKEKRRQLTKEESLCYLAGEN